MLGQMTSSMPRHRSEYRLVSSAIVFCDRELIDDVVNVPEEAIEDTIAALLAEDSSSREWVHLAKRCIPLLRDDFERCFGGARIP
jgi:hypothetical protein